MGTVPTIEGLATQGLVLSVGEAYEHAAHWQAFEDELVEFGPAGTFRASKKRKVADSGHPVFFKPLR